MDLRHRHFSSKMYAKTKELGPVGRGVRRARPLDPPMECSDIYTIAFPTSEDSFQLQFIMCTECYMFTSNFANTSTSQDAKKKKRNETHCTAVCFSFGNGKRNKWETHLQKAELSLNPTDGLPVHADWLPSLDLGQR